MPLMFKNGKPLLVNGAITTDTDCCQCTSGATCWYRWRVYWNCTSLAWEAPEADQVYCQPQVPGPLNIPQYMGTYTHPTYGLTCLFWVYTAGDSCSTAGECVASVAYWPTLPPNPLPDELAWCCGDPEYPYCYYVWQYAMSCDEEAYASRFDGVYFACASKLSDVNISGSTTWGPPSALATWEYLGSEERDGKTVCIYQYARASHLCTTATDCNLCPSVCACPQLYVRVGIGAGGAEHDIPMRKAAYGDPDACAWFSEDADENPIYYDFVIGGTTYKLTFAITCEDGQWRFRVVRKWMEEMWETCSCWFSLGGVGADLLEFYGTLVSDARDCDEAVCAAVSPSYLYLTCTEGVWPTPGGVGVIAAASDGGRFVKENWPDAPVATSEDAAACCDHAPCDCFPNCNELTVTLGSATCFGVEMAGTYTLTRNPTEYQWTKSGGGNGPALIALGCENGAWTLLIWLRRGSLTLTLPRQFPCGDWRALGAAETVADAGGCLSGISVVVAPGDDCVNCNECGPVPCSDCSACATTYCATVRISGVLHAVTLFPGGSPCVWAGLGPFEALSLYCVDSRWQLEGVGPFVLWSSNNLTGCPPTDISAWTRDYGTVELVSITAGAC